MPKPDHGSPAVSSPAPAAVQSSTSAEQANAPAVEQGNSHVPAENKGVASKEQAITAASSGNGSAAVSSVHPNTPAPSSDQPVASLEQGATPAPLRNALRNDEHVPSRDNDITAAEQANKTNLSAKQANTASGNENEGVVTERATVTAPSRNERALASLVRKANTSAPSGDKPASTVEQAEAPAPSGDKGEPSLDLAKTALNSVEQANGTSPSGNDMAITTLYKKLPEAQLANTSEDTLSEDVSIFAAKPVGVPGIIQDISVEVTSKGSIKRELSSAPLGPGGDKKMESVEGTTTAAESSNKAKSAQDDSSSTEEKADGDKRPAKETHVPTDSQAAEAPASGSKGDRSKGKKASDDDSSSEEDSPKKDIAADEVGHKAQPTKGKEDSSEEDQKNSVKKATAVPDLAEDAEYKEKADKGAGSGEGETARKFSADQADGEKQSAETLDDDAGKAKAASKEADESEKHGNDSGKKVAGLRNEAKPIGSTENNGKGETGKRSSGANGHDAEQTPFYSDGETGKGSAPGRKEWKRTKASDDDSSSEGGKEPRKKDTVAGEAGADKDKPIEDKEDNSNNGDEKKSVKKAIAVPDPAAEDTGGREKADKDLGSTEINGDVAFGKKSSGDQPGGEKQSAETLDGDAATVPELGRAKEDSDREHGKDSANQDTAAPESLDEAKPKGSTEINGEDETGKRSSGDQAKIEASEEEYDADKVPSKKTVALTDNEAGKGGKKDSTKTASDDGSSSETEKDSPEKGIAVGEAGGSKAKPSKDKEKDGSDGNEGESVKKAIAAPDPAEDKGRGSTVISVEGKTDKKSQVENDSDGDDANADKHAAKTPDSANKVKAGDPGKSSKAHERDKHVKSDTPKKASDDDSSSSEEGENAAKKGVASGAFKNEKMNREDVDKRAKKPKVEDQNIEEDDNTDKPKNAKNKVDGTAGEDTDKPKKATGEDDSSEEEDKTINKNTKDDETNMDTDKAKKAEIEDDSSEDEDKDTKKAKRAKDGEAEKGTEKKAKGEHDSSEEGKAAKKPADDDSKTVNGGWSPWSPCSKECGGGFKIRTCNKPPPEGSGKCQADSMGNKGKKPCNSQYCEGEEPVDGVWSDWGECTKSCGRGTQERTCSNPKPKNNGADCEGGTSQACNTQECPTTQAPKVATHEAVTDAPVVIAAPVDEGGGFGGKRGKNGKKGKRGKYAGKETAPVADDTPAAEAAATEVRKGGLPTQPTSLPCVPKEVVLALTKDGLELTFEIDITNECTAPSRLGAQWSIDDRFEAGTVREIAINDIQAKPYQWLLPKADWNLLDFQTYCLRLVSYGPATEGKAPVSNPVVAKPACAKLMPTTSEDEPSELTEKNVAVEVSGLSVAGMTLGTTTTELVDKIRAELSDKLGIAKERIADILITTSREDVVVVLAPSSSTDSAPSISTTEAAERLRAIITAAKGKAEGTEEKVLILAPSKAEGIVVKLREIPPCADGRYRVHCITVRSEVPKTPMDSQLMQFLAAVLITFLACSYCVRRCKGGAVQGGYGQVGQASGTPVAMEEPTDARGPASPSEPSLGWKEDDLEDPADEVTKFLTGVLKVKGVGSPDTYLKPFQDQYLTRLEQLEALDQNDWKRLKLPERMIRAIRDALQERQEGRAFAAANEGSLNKPNKPVKKAVSSKAGTSSTPPRNKRDVTEKPKAKKKPKDSGDKNAAEGNDFEDNDSDEDFGTAARRSPKTSRKSSQPGDELDEWLSGANSTENV